MTSEAAVLISGWTKPDILWIPMQYWLKEAGYDSIIGTYPHQGFAPIQYSSRTVTDSIEECLRLFDRVYVIGHSMGGLIGRYILASNKLESNKRIAGFVSIATPHKGSSYANFAPWSKSASQMRPGSDFLSRLANLGWPKEIPALALHASWDGVVSRDSCRIEFGDNIVIKGVTHGSIILDKRTATAITSWLQTMAPLSAMRETE